MSITQKMIRAAAIGLAALALAQCSPPASGGAAGAKKDDIGAQMSAGFDKGFNDSFAKGALDSCVKSATASGAAASLAESYCGCFVDQLKPLSVQEKMNLKPDSEAVKKAAATCKAKTE